MAAAVPCCCLTPVDAVGLLVGRSGAAVRQLSRDTGCEISITGEDDTPPTLSDRIVTLRGDMSQKEAACRDIIRIIHGTQELTENERGVFVLVVPASALPPATGLQPAVAAEIARCSGAEVEVSPTCIGGTELNPVILSGTLDETLFAVGEIDALLQRLADRKHLEEARPQRLSAGSAGPRGAEGCGASPGSAAGSLGSRSTTPGRGASSRSVTPGRTAPSSRSLTPGRRRSRGAAEASVRFLVSTPVAAWIVGKGGRTVAELSSRVGVAIDVARDGGASRIVEISGAHGKLMHAIQVLLETIDAFPGGSPREIRVLVPAAVVGQLVASGVFREIHASVGAHLELAELGSGGDQILVISGALLQLVQASQKAVQVLVEADAAYGARAGRGRQDAGAAAVTGGSAWAAGLNGSALPLAGASLGNGHSSGALPCSAEIPDAGSLHPPAALPARPWEAKGGGGEAALLQALLAGPNIGQAQLRLFLPGALLRAKCSALGAVCQRTGSRIDVGAGGDQERQLVTITGTMMGNSMAVYYIQELMARLGEQL